MVPVASCARSGVTQTAARSRPMLYRSPLMMRASFQVRAKEPVAHRSVGKRDHNRSPRSDGAQEFLSGGAGARASAAKLAASTTCLRVEYPAETGVVKRDAACLVSYPWRPFSHESGPPDRRAGGGQNRCTGSGDFGGRKRTTRLRAAPR